MPSLSMNVPLEAFLNAKLPSSVTNPNASSSSVPASCSRTPSSPSMSSVTDVDGPVATSSGIPAYVPPALKSSTGAPAVVLVVLLISR